MWQDYLISHDDNNHDSRCRGSNCGDSCHLVNYALQRGFVTPGPDAALIYNAKYNLYRNCTATKRGDHLVHIWYCSINYLKDIKIFIDEYQLTTNTRDFNHNPPTPFFIFFSIIIVAVLFKNWILLYISYLVRPIKITNIIFFLHFNWIIILYTSSSFK